MKNKELQEIQEQYCSSYDKRKLCSYDVEFIDSDTKPLIHQASRFWFFMKGKALQFTTKQQLDIKGTVLFCGEGNGTPLQYSCLENPMDGGTW